VNPILTEQQEITVDHAHANVGDRIPALQAASLIIQIPLDVQEGLQKEPDFTVSFILVKIWQSLYALPCWESSGGIATAYGLDDRGSNPGKGKIFLLSTTSRPALGPNQSPI
jgi:hypothetical protein